MQAPRRGCGIAPAGRQAAKLAALVTVMGAGVAAAGPTASAPGPSRWTLQTSAPVSALAADGGLAAVETRPRVHGCGQVFVWDARRQTSRRWSTHTNCAGSAGLPYLQTGQDELALAGTRVAWLETVTLDPDARTTLWTATLREPRARKLATAEAGAASDLSGRYLGHLHGDGMLLAYNRWTYCEQFSDQPGCGPGAPRLRESLYRIDGGGKAALVPVVANAALTWVDGGRLATGFDPIQLFDRSGRLLQTVTTGPQDRHGLALGGRQLALVNHGETLEVYDTRTGSPAQTWPVVSYAASAARLVDLQDGIALYLVARQVHVLRIADGRDRTLAVSPGHIPTRRSRRRASGSPTTPRPATAASYSSPGARSTRRSAELRARAKGNAVIGPPARPRAGRHPGTSVSKTRAFQRR